MIGNVRVRGEIKTGVFSLGRNQSWVSIGKEHGRHCEKGKQFNSYEGCTK